MIPALAAEAESAKTAPATANLIFLFIGKVRELSHQAIDEVLKTIGEIYEQEY